jgi:OmpR-family two-component system manganese-sensing sensor histidine kinase
LQVRVSDTGIGISEEALPHIFKRFYRVDPARSHNRKLDRDTGSGLGLAIARGIVTNHRGKIQVESQLGRGTTVTLSLPTLAPPEGRSGR